MTDIIRKNGNVPATQAAAEWDPFRAMREMLRFDPYRELAPLASFRMFEAPTFSPSFEVTENKEAFLFKVDVPGVKKEDIEITTTGNRLQISGKREVEQETKNDAIYTYERQYGSFSRAFTLPEGVDVEHAKSELKDGVLTLVIPKVPGAQAKKIAVGTPVNKS